jgi:hypothetical protein
MGFSLPEREVIKSNLNYFDDTTETLLNKAKTAPVVNP